MRSESWPGITAIESRILRVAYACFLRIKNEPVSGSRWIQTDQTETRGDHAGETHQGVLV
jgi:hypothetical protein